MAAEFRVHMSQRHGDALGPCMATPLLSEADIQEWLDEKSPADLVSALYQMLEPPAWADELSTPTAPITTPAPDMFTECMQRPHIPAWPKTATGAADVGALFVGTPPLRADALPPKRPRDVEFECHTVVQSKLQQQQQHLALVQNEKQLARIAVRREFVLRELATRPPSGINKLSQKRSERASKRPRGPRGRYLPHDEIADVV